MDGVARIFFLNFRRLRNRKIYRDEAGRNKHRDFQGNSSQRYELVGKKQAAAIEKKILAGIKPENSSRKISADQTAAFKMARGFDMEDVKTIRYASKDSSVAAIDKNGKITAKKPGKTVVTAEATLKNGKKKTVKMTVEVTE